MIDLIVSIYNGTFIVFVLFINIFIAFYFIKKFCDTFQSDGDIKSGSILITGCDSGFGRDAALEFSKRNIHVFAGCPLSQSVKDFNENKNFNGTAFTMDITKKEDITKARKVIEDKVGEKGLWCLLNNAGVFTPGPIEWINDDIMKRTMEINTWGAVNVTKEMIPLLKKAGGRIVNTTSIVGRVSLGNSSAYCMSKYALEAFSDCLRHEMKFWGVSVHIIEPGVCLTTMFRTNEKQWRDLWDAQPESIQIQYGDEYVDGSLVSSKKNVKQMSANLKFIVKAYLHAALSSSPRLRYVVGVDANTFYMAIATLPTAIGDWIYESIFNKAIPAGAKY